MNNLKLRPNNQKEFFFLLSYIIRKRAVYNKGLPSKDVGPREYIDFCKNLTRDISQCCLQR